MSQIDAKMIVPAALSIFGTSLVVLSYILFKPLRQLRYVELVFYIAANDLIASTGVVLGDSTTGTFGCGYQAFVSNYNFLCSVFWSTVVGYQLYAIVMYGAGLVDMKYLHMFIWTFPLIVTLLPLSTNIFGTDDDDAWCFIANRKNSPSYGILLWTILAFYLWLWICILLILAFFIAVYCKLHSYGKTAVNPASSALYRLAIYPGILVVCWIVPTINDMRAAVVGYYEWKTMNDIASITPALQGFLLAIVFFRRNKAVQQEWYNLLWKSGQSVHLLQSKSSSSQSASTPRIRSLPSNRSSNMTLTDNSLCITRSSDMSSKSRLSAEMATFDTRTTFSDVGDGIGDSISEGKSLSFSTWKSFSPKPEDSHTDKSTVSGQFNSSSVASMNDL